MTISSDISAVVPLVCRVPQIVGPLIFIAYTEDIK